MNSPASEYKNPSIEFASGYYKMSHLFRYYVKNTPASRVCTFIGHLYRFGLHRFAQITHNHVLRPLVRTDEWSLVIVYGRKVGMLPA